MKRIISLALVSSLALSSHSQAFTLSFGKKKEEEKKTEQQKPQPSNNARQGGGLQLPENYRGGQANDTARPTNTLEQIQYEQDAKKRELERSAEYQSSLDAIRRSNEQRQQQLKNRPNASLYEQQLNSLQKINKDVDYRDAIDEYRRLAEAEKKKTDDWFVEMQKTRADLHHFHEAEKQRIAREHDRINRVEEYQWPKDNKGIASNKLRITETSYSWGSKDSNYDYKDYNIIVEVSDNSANAAYTDFMSNMLSSGWLVDLQRTETESFNRGGNRGYQVINKIQIRFKAHKR